MSNFRFRHSPDDVDVRGDFNLQKVSLYMHLYNSRLSLS